MKRFLAVALMLLAGLNMLCLTAFAAENGSSTNTTLVAPTASDNEASAESTADEPERPEKLSYKVWVTGGIVLLAAACALVILIKKKSSKNLIIVGVLAAVGIAFVLFTNFESADSYYASDARKSDIIGEVTLTIRCDTIPDKTPEHIPDDGVILEKTRFEIKEGDTVYSLLLSAAKEHRIHIETSGGADSPYVEGINNIYEFDFGDLSGWQYFVNGESSSVGCGDYTLSDSDEIEWLYTCNMGEDLK